MRLVTVNEIILENWNNFRCPSYCVLSQFIASRNVRRILIFNLIIIILLLKLAYPSEVRRKLFGYELVFRFYYYFGVFPFYLNYVCPKMLEDFFFIFFFQK